MHGRIKGKPLGSYPLDKGDVTIEVTVVLMRVSRCDEHWEEEGRRERQWVTADDAASLIARVEQRKLLTLALKRI